jgi:hypothetical protein
LPLALRLVAVKKPPQAAIARRRARRAARKGRHQIKIRKARRRGIE